MSEKLQTGLKTVGFGPYPLLKKEQKHYSLDVDKISERIAFINAEVERLTGTANFSREKENIAARSGSLPLKKVVSGKDFMFPVIWLKLREFADFTCNLDHFKIQLARSFDKRLDPQLGKVLRGMVT